MERDLLSSRLVELIAKRLEDAAPRGMGWEPATTTQAPSTADAMRTLFRTTKWWTGSPRFCSPARGTFLKVAQTDVLFTESSIATR